MTDFNEWWQKEEDLMRKQGANDEMVLRAMRSIAEMAWNAALDAAAEYAEDKELAAMDEWEALEGYANIADDIRGMKND